MHEALGGRTRQHASDGSAVRRADYEQSRVLGLSRLVQRAGGARVLDFRELDRDALRLEFALDLPERSRGVRREVLVHSRRVAASRAAEPAQTDAMTSGAPVKRAAATAKSTGARSKVCGSYPTMIGLLMHRS